MANEEIKDTDVVEEVTAEEVETVSPEETNTQEAALEELAHRYQRLQADFENYKRRTMQEKEQLSSYVKSNVIEDLLPVLDNFERAVQAPVTPDNKAFLEGFIMIHQHLMGLLSKQGLAVIEAVGQPFDPNFHQAIMRVPSEEYPDDTVCEVLQTGYTMDGKTIRPAMVKVVHND